MFKVKNYIIKTLYYWIIENNLTPYVLFNSSNNLEILNNNFINKDKNMNVLLDISLIAIEHLKWNNKSMNFNASFNKEIFNIHIMLSSIVSLYSYETSEGININNNLIEIVEKEDIDISYLKLI